jgi:hypothetical protein
MLGPFSIDTYLPSFPSIAAEFHLGIDTVQQTLTVFLLAMAVMTLVALHIFGPPIGPFESDLSLWSGQQ